VPARFVELKEKLPPRARLIIEQIEMENFKSYAGVKSVGPFHKSFSAVVGPNGSGKSNVIDALQFVFGKRAAKIRFKKLSDLIHNSTQHTNLSRARVLVSFVYIVDSPDGGFDAVPGSAFSVERVVLRSGQCDYILDGSRSSWGEVTAVLKDQGIDLDHNRFLILQGEVEQISLMKPKGTTAHEEGLLEYLEDIIGSNQFVEPIAAAASNLEAAVTDHDAALVRAHFAEGELRKLAALRDEAEQHFGALMELCDKRALGVRLEQFEADSRSKDAHEQEAKLAERMEENAALLAQREQAQADFAANFKAENKRMKEAVAEQQGAKDALAEFERKEVAVSEELKHGRENEKKIASKIKKLGKDLSEKQALQKLAAKLPELEATLKKSSASQQAEEQKLEAMYEELKGESTKIHVRLEQKQTQMLPWTKKLNDAQSELEVSTSELDMLRRQTGKRTAALNKAQQERAQIDEALLRQQEALERANETLSSSKARETELKGHVKRLEEEEAKTQGELRDVRDRLMASRSEADSNSGMGKIIRLLGKAQEANLVTGFYGRLGDLGTIDPKYDIAVSTAAPGLNNLIIETEKEAAKCIALMKKKEAGRATFCILDRQRDLAQKCKNKIDTPEGVPRLFDLVRPVDERFAPAFYHALRDTLVATDIDQGSRIAYEQKDGRRWRVVTLDGKIIDLAGTMTGGGSRPMTGLLKLLSDDAAKAKKGAQHTLGAATKEDVERLTQEEGSKLKELDRIMNELAAAQQQLKLLYHDLERCALEAPKLKMQLDSYAGRKTDLAKRLPELERACGLSAEEKRDLARLEEEVRVKTGQLEVVRADTRGLQSQIDELKQQLEGLGGDSVKHQKELVDRISQQVEEMSGKISDTKVSLFVCCLLFLTHANTGSSDWGGKSGAETAEAVERGGEGAGRGGGGFGAQRGRAGRVDGEVQRRARALSSQVRQRKQAGGGGEEAVTRERARGQGHCRAEDGGRGSAQQAGRHATGLVELREQQGQAGAALGRGGAQETRLLETVSSGSGREDARRGCR
jgi:structural maintenance of chromosome 4